MAVAVKIKFDKEYTKLIAEFERQFPDVIDSTVRGVTSDAKEKIMEATPVKTGFLKGNWLISKLGLGQYNISNKTSYVNHLEFGTADHGPVTAEYLHFPIKAGNSITGWVRTKMVKGIKEKRMLRDVMPWIAEQMPMRMKAVIETMWTNTFRR